MNLSISCSRVMLSAMMQPSFRDSILAPLSVIQGDGEGA